MAKGSLQIFLLVILGLTVIFSVATFASGTNPAERPISYVTCQINPKDIICVTPAPATVMTPKTAPVISYPGDPACKSAPNTPLCKVSPAPAASSSSKAK